MAVNIPNRITKLRNLLAPVAWCAAVAGERWLLVFTILLCLLTDFLDGFFARLLGQETSFGAKLDSIADNILPISAMPIAWLVGRFQWGFLSDSCRRPLSNFM